MAIYPSSFDTKDTLAPGGHGEEFLQTLPGDRSGEKRIARSNNTFNVSQHDVPNIKYNVDDRLPWLFKYGFAVGFNHIIAPKGRIAAIDPYMNLVDFDSYFDPVQKKKQEYNSVTIANGGTPVKLREATDTYPESDKLDDKSQRMYYLFSADASAKAMKNAGKEWTPLIGMGNAYYQDCYRPFADTAKGTTALAQLKTAGYDIDAPSDPSDIKPHTGLVIDKDKKTVANVRPGNKPMGVFQRNEYTRGVDAFNGMMCGPILTDAMIELPLFLYKDKAEGNYWGSAYGQLLPGDLVKSDENGRFVKSPLSSTAALEAMKANPVEFELERQQVIGEVYSVNHNLVPEGAARWAVWALADRLNYDGFNPEEYTQTNRKGEDAIDHSAHNSTGYYPGYPYDKAYSNNDLNILASSKADTFNPRMNAEYQYSELGIPGLTDGYNAYVREMPEEKAGTARYRGDNATVDYARIFMRLLNVQIEEGSLQMRIGDGDWTDPAKDVIADGFVYKSGTAANLFTVDFCDIHQGIVVVTVNKDEDGTYTKADAFLKQHADGVNIFFKYKKRGLAGVPTWMDWDGCIGSVKILLNK